MTIIVLFAAALLALAPITAQGMPPWPVPLGYNCPAPLGIPRYRDGFAQLHEVLGDDITGDAWSCEFPDPRGTGDVLQFTWRGLAFWRKATNTPTFTNGVAHWALVDTSPVGVVWWTGTSVDPPADALPGRGQGDVLLQHDSP